ncbi:MAG: dynamin family protein [Corynebacterium sp.]|nr:dynamin family protein [Corynebacterium sp.]
MTEPHSGAGETTATTATGAVATLRDTVADTHFPTNEAADGEAHAIVDQIDDYIAPRLSHLEAPLLAVVGGSTGAGKSALVNAIVGQEVSPSGVIRPTTRQPVLVYNEADRDWFSSDAILPGLAREFGPANPQATTLRMVSAPIGPSLALLDAPDFDSIDDRNRALASQLLAAADLWLFVTTPARYADQLVWNFLQDAASRNIEVVVLLNRLDPDTAEEITSDLHRMMAEAGLGTATVFTVLEAEDGNIDVAAIRQYLDTLAADAAARRATAGKTLSGAVNKLVARTEALAEDKAREEGLEHQLVTVIDENYQAGARDVIEATADGNLLRNEVMARWQDFVGTSEVFRSVESWYAKAVDSVARFFTGRTRTPVEVEENLESGLHAVIVDAAETAATKTFSYLGSAAPHLRASGDASLAHASADISEQAAQLVRDWQHDLVHHIEETAASKRMTARLVSLGLNVATVALMIVVFASTAGLTGGEIAIAGGSAVVGQKLLETIFGEETVRRMAATARQDLNTRIRDLYQREADRFDTITGTLVAGSSSDELRAAAAAAATAMKGL